MKTLQRRRSHFEELHALLSDPAAIAALHREAHLETKPDPAIAEWLGHLQLFHGVPFELLVPDARMLPVESIRFFQIDRNWVYSLLEGALSVGTSTSSEAAHATVLAGGLHGAATSACRQIRALRASATAPLPSLSGFLLRSAVVEGWSGLEVTAWDAQDVELGNVLRMERLGPSVLLFIVEGLIDHVDIHEPPEGLHFGIDPDGTKAIRYVTVSPNSPPDAHPGTQIEGANAGTVPVREGTRVVRVNDFAGMVAAALKKADANTGQFTAAEFALELVEGVQSVRFVNGPQVKTA